MEPGSERPLENPAQDGISSLAFSPSSSNLLLISSWDKTARLYDGTSNVAKGIWRNHAAVLDCAVQDDQTGFSGGLDRAVRMIYLNRPEDPGLNIGSHAKPVSCMEFSRELGALVTGGWDGHVHIWDPRTQGEARSLPASEKVFTLAVSGNRIVVGTSDRSVLIYDVRKLNDPQDRRESSLKHQTRCIRISPDNSGYVLASVEGRVAVEYFDLSPAIQAKRYAFKCHRQGDLVFPVNAVAFHPTYGTFATGGCDGMVYTWDGQNKKRLAQLGPYKTSIAALAYNFDGSLLAVAASYTYEEGDKEHPIDAVYLRCPLEGEVRRKVKAAGPSKLRNGRPGAALSRAPPSLRQAARGMFWRSHQNQPSPPPSSQAGDGEDGYDQYVWEEEGEETKSGLHGVRFTVSTSAGGASSEQYGYDGQDEEEGGLGGARPTGSPRLSGLFSRFGHQEGSQLLLGGSRKSLPKINHKNSRSSMTGEASAGSLASGGGASTSTHLKSLTPSGSSRTTPRGSPTHPSNLGRSGTLRARSPQTTTLLQTDTVFSDSRHRLDQLHGGSGESGSSKNLRRSGSMPVRLGVHPSFKPSNAAIAAAAVAAAHQADRVRRSMSRGSGMTLDEDTGMWNSVSVGGTKGLKKSDGSKVMLGIDPSHMRPSFQDVGRLEKEAEERGGASAVGVLVSFGYYLVMPALSVFQGTRRFVRANQMRVLSSLIILVILTLCIILAAVHLPSHAGKHHIRGEPWGTEPFIAPHGHSGTMLGAAEGGQYRNLFSEMLHKSEAEIDKKLGDTWRLLFEGNPTNEAIYFPVGATPEGDKLGYMTNTESGWVTSEAMSYGMMAAVQFEKKEVFDALWAWSTRYMRHITGKYKDFFAWQCSLAGQKMDPTPAPDGEEWFATALIFAHNRWSSTGRYNYEKEALSLLAAMADPQRGMFSVKGEVTLNPVQPTITNPSYHLPQFYEVWARFLTDRGQVKAAAFYLMAASKSRILWRKATNRHTGLAADYTDFDGVGIKDLSGHSNFQWDAWRVVANLAVDWSWWRRDPWQQREADTLQAFLFSKGIQNYPSTYSLNGTAILVSHSVGLVAVNAVASLAATDKNVATAFVAELWNAEIPANKWRYYNGILAFLSLLQVSGRYRSYY